jgi:hypothetical protein
MPRSSSPSCNSKPIEIRRIADGEFGFSSQSVSFVSNVLTAVIGQQMGGL